MLCSPLLSQDWSGEDPGTRDTRVPAQGCCMGRSGSEPGPSGRCMPLGAGQRLSALQTRALLIPISKKQLMLTGRETYAEV